jgi:hypothetical protein
MTDVAGEQFRSAMLERARLAFLKRRKALNYRGRLSFERSPQGESLEWLRFVHRAGNRPDLVLELESDGFLRVCARSNLRVDRGTELFRLECERCFDCPDRVLSAFEASIGVLRRSVSRGGDHLQELMGRAWEGVCPRAQGSD